MSRQCQHEIVTRIFKIQAVHIELDSDTNRKTTEVLRKQQEMLDAYNVLYSLLVSAIRSLPAGGARVVDAQRTWIHIRVKTEARHHLMVTRTIFSYAFTSTR